jgi:hypothetical protein
LGKFKNRLKHFGSIQKAVEIALALLEKKFERALCLLEKIEQALSRLTNLLKQL